MSIDLDWEKLNRGLAQHLVDVLNRQLASTETPSFIGPVQVCSLDFGSAAPDVELVDLRDIYRDFLEDDEDTSDDKDVKVTETDPIDDEDGYEWVSRRAARQADGFAYQHLPAHMRYGQFGRPDMSASMPSLMNPPMDLWNAGMSVPHLNDFRAAAYAYGGSPFPRTPLHRTSLSTAPSPPTPPKEEPPLRRSSSTESLDTRPDTSSSEPPQPAAQPNLQLHLYVTWNSDLRITLTTSLLINYPSPSFMSLPIKLSVTGLVFNGEVAVAYEGERRRIHLCILDDLDPYGPATAKRRDPTPPELLMDESEPITPSVLAAASASTAGIQSGAYSRAKPKPVGQRLLPSIVIESEIGQTDKHVLRNVTRVEKFIQDMIRKTVEEELVFPNFHTLVMGDG